MTQVNATFLVFSTTGQEILFVDRYHKDILPSHVIDDSQLYPRHLAEELEDLTGLDNDSPRFEQVPLDLKNNVVYVSHAENDCCLSVCAHWRSTKDTLDSFSHSKNVVEQALVPELQKTLWGLAPIA